MSDLNIEVNGIDMEGSVFRVLLEIAKNKIYDAEMKQDTQRQDVSCNLDAAEIAGKLTDDFYRLINKAT